MLVSLSACDGRRDARDATDAGDDAGTDSSVASGANAGLARNDAGRVIHRPPFPDAGVTPYRCDIGVADPATGDYAPLASGGDVPIGGAGQAGLTARLAIRLAGVESPGTAFPAIVRVVLTNPAADITADSSPWDIRVPLECRDDGACYRSPVLIEISHIAKLPELEGLAVDLAARILDPDDLERVLAQATGSGILRRY